MKVSTGGLTTWTGIRNDEGGMKRQGCLKWSEECLKETLCLGRIVDSTKSLWRRLIWSVLFLLASGALISQAVELVRSYYEFPVTVNVEYNFSKSLLFPAVTFCNLNPVRNSVVNGSRFERTKRSALTNSKSDFTSQNCSNLLTPGSGEPGVLDFSDLGCLNSGVSQSQSEPDNAYDAFIQALDKTFTAKFVAEQKIEHRFDELHPTFDELKKMGHTLDAMLLDCLWKGQRCSSR
jgi:hypothetical protein